MFEIIGDLGTAGGCALDASGMLFRTVNGKPVAQHRSLWWAPIVILCHMP